MADKNIDHLKSHLKKWEKDWILNTNYRLAGYHVSHHVETATLPPAPLSWELIELRTQLQKMQLDLSAQNQSIETVPGTVSLASMQLIVATGTNTASTVTTSQLAYFWAHGSSKNTEHCSTTCHNCVIGHQNTATFHKNLGGSSRVYSKRDKRFT